MSPVRKEGARRRIVGLSFVVYGLLIFEGTLRRWLFPQYEYFFYFIRDPFVIWIYWLVLRHRLLPSLHPFLVIGIFFSLVSILLVHIQIMTGGYDNHHLILTAYGWRNYFFYIPLSFIIAKEFHQSDLNRLIKFTLAIAIPSAILVVLQFYSSVTSAINLGSSFDEAHQFRNLGAALGYVRPTGFFTSTAGHVDFVGSLICVILAFWIIPKTDRPISKRLLMVGTVAAVIMLAMSGSRGLFVRTGICLLASLLSALIIQNKKLVARSFFVPLLLTTAFVVAYPILFPTASKVFTTRWSEAYAEESQVFKYGIFGRMFFGQVQFVKLLADTPSQGYLLGIGGNAAQRLSWVRYPKEAQKWTGYGGWIETGFSRHIAELGPFVGILFIFYRIGFTCWLGRRALRAAHRKQDPLPLILFSFVAVLLFCGQITGHGTHNGYVWLFVGFCLAACKTVDKKLKTNEQI